MMSIGAMAQAPARYSLATSVGSYTPISVAGGATACATAPADDVFQNIPGLTAFSVNGVSYTNYQMNSNGRLSLYTATAPTTTGTYTPLSSAITNAAVVFAPFGADLNTSTAATSAWFYQTIGTELVFQWTNFSRYNVGPGNDILNFQVRLNTATGSVTYVYGATTVGSPLGLPQVGFRTSTTFATDVNNLNLNITGSPITCDWSNAVTGFANTSNLYMNATNAGVKPANGLTYTWTNAGAVNSQLPVRTFTAPTAITTSGASLAWTAATGATGYNVQYRIPGSCTWTNWSGNPVATSSVALTGLTASTVYQVRVQARNATANAIFSHTPSSTGTGDGYSAAGTFTTLANICTGTPVAGTVTPALQNLCTGTVPSNLVATGFTTGATGLTFQWQQSTDNVTFVTVVGGTGGTTTTYTPPAFTGTPLYYRLRITCSGSGLTGDSASVLVTTPANPITQATALVLSNVSYSGLTATWTNGTGTRRVVYLSNTPIVDPVNSTGSAVFVANTVYSGSGQQIVSDGTSATVSVTGLTLGTLYYVKVFEYLRCGAGPYDYYFNTTTGTNASSTTTSLATPAPWTESFATTTLPTNWINGTAWTVGTTTALLPVTTNVIYKNLYSFSTTANFTTLIVGSLPANQRLTLIYKLANFASPYDVPAAASGNFVIAVSTNSGTTFTDVLTTSNNGLAGWQPLSLDLAAYAGQNVRLRITGNWTSGDYYLGFDNLKIDTTPTCFEPTALTVGSITTSSANVSWTAPIPTPGVGYEYAVTTSATPPASGTSVTGTSASVTGLSAQTTYYLHVRSECIAGIEFSTWATSASFTTPCNAVSVPYSEGFESITTAGTLPACMQASPTISVAGKTQTYIASGSNSALVARTGTKYAAVFWNPSASGYFFSAPLQLTAGVSYSSSVFYKTDGVAWTDVTLSYGTAATPAAMTNTIATVANAAATVYTQVTGSFIPTVTGTYYVSCRAFNATTAPNYCAFDDLSVIVSPPSITSFAPSTVCSADLGTTVVTLTGANLSDATSVEVNGVSTPFTIVSATSITVNLAVTTTAGLIKVISPNGFGVSATGLVINTSPTVNPTTGASNDLCIPSTLVLSNTTNLGVWSSSNTLVATVDAGGTVSGVSAGSVVISYTLTTNGCSTSATYPVNVKLPISISASPVAVTVLTGSNATFNVTASGTTPSYQWEVSADSGASFNPLANDATYSGVTTNSLSITATPDTLNTYEYRCVVSGSSPCSPATSSSAVLTVGNTGIVTDPSNVNLCNSGTATFTVVASGSVNGYQWFEDDGSGALPISNGGNYSGANSASLTITGVTTLNNGYNYYVVIDGPANDPQSNVAILNVATGVSVSNPSNQTVCYSGGTSTFVAAPAGSSTTLVWEYSADNVSFGTVSNGTPLGATYAGQGTGSLLVTTTAATPAAGTYYYRLLVNANSPCPSVPSLGAQLIINNPTVSTQPAAASVLAGNATSFTVATAAPSPTFQWQRATTVGGVYANVVNGTPVGVSYTDATTATLNVSTLNSTAESTANFYRAVVTSGGCSVNSNGGQLTITNYCQPATTVGGASDSVVNVVISNTSAGTNVTQPSSGAAPWYTLYNNTPLNVGQLQNMSVSMTFGADGSQHSAIWIDYNKNGVFETSENVAISTTAAAGNATVNYTFSIPLTASTGVTRIRVRGASDGVYTAAGACASATYGETEDYFLNIIAAPACSGAPVAGTAVSSVSNVCVSGTANLSVSGFTTGVTGISAQWYNSAGAISGATGSTYTTPVLTAPESYFYRVTCANGGLFTDSNTLSIGVNNPTVDTTTPGTRCGTGSVALSATGSAGTSVNWYATPTGGATLFTGSTFNTPSIAATTTYYVGAGIGSTSEVGGKLAPSQATSFVGNATGIIFSASNTINLNTAVIYPVGTGTLTVALYDSVGTELATTAAIAVTGSGLTTPVTFPLNFTVSPGTGYRLLVKASTGITGLVRDNSSNVFPYNTTSTSVTSGYISGNSTSYYFFYNLGITTGCSSARTAVVATVTPSPALAISGSATTLCVGQSSAPVTVTTGTADYNIFTWSPSLGVSGNVVSGYTFNPTVTTAYTLTATQSAGGCANTATYTVTVNPLPNVFTITPSSAQVCSNLAPVLLAVGSVNVAPVGGCLTASEGQFPSGSFTATNCNGSFANVITGVAYAGEYSLVNVSANTKYVFTSTGAGDYVTISDASQTTVLAAGLSPVTWTSSVAGQVSFFTHTNSACGEAAVSRTRSFTCEAIAPVVWSPSAGLFSDTLGTVAYAGDPSVSVYAKPSVTTLYTATATSAAGCVRTNTVNVTASVATTWYVDADNDGYGNIAITTLACAQPSGYVALGTDCNDANNQVSPGKPEILYNAIDDNCDGNLDEGFQIVTQLNATNSCNQTLLTISQLIYANIVSGLNVGYRFKVTDMQTNAVQTIDRNLHWFGLGLLSSYEYARTYKIEVMIRRNGVWLGYYGGACFVTTPALSSVGVGSGVSATQCGTTLATISTIIYTIPVANATGYRFKLTNTVTGLVQTIDRTLHWFSITNFPKFTYGTTYAIEVAVKTTSTTYSPYGATCTITTPDVLGLVAGSCGVTLPSNSTIVYTTPRDRVTTYRFQLINTNTNAVKIIDRTLHWFGFNVFAGYAPGTAYEVRVAYQTTGDFSIFSEVCTVTSPGTARGDQAETITGIPVAATAFDVMSFPNPFTSNFGLDIKTLNEGNVGIKVYDMIGKLIEVREVQLSDIQNQSIGDKYPSGVYNMIVTQGENIKTLRVIKR